eukprot:m.66244 g.66244  ORF g.66244 m.66244 type:complete len:63 (+) comp16549_c0_seq1:57-245(+)
MLLLLPHPLPFAAQVRFQAMSTALILTIAITSSVPGIAFLGGLAYNLYKRWGRSRSGYQPIN